ncbi:hypothetical protein GN244_ATG12430 [Phytophthora infestans]|uniref:Uncharacterized protein n=1 Tax=Phytophthora infestans TaxID=4787 RepID=A0A833SLD1_PHYIN|nr:hypothetical protein GN244_ATG12430 [Phytophthora infestans]
MYLYSQHFGSLFSLFAYFCYQYPRTAATSSSARRYRLRAAVVEPLPKLVASASTAVGSTKVPVAVNVRVITLLGSLLVAAFTGQSGTAVAAAACLSTRPEITPSVAATTSTSGARFSSVWLSAATVSVPAFPAIITASPLASSSNATAPLLIYSSIPATVTASSLSSSGTVTAPSSCPGPTVSCFRHSARHSSPCFDHFPGYSAQL